MTAPSGAGREQKHSAPAQLCDGADCLQYRGRAANSSSRTHTQIGPKSFCFATSKGFQLAELDRRLTQHGNRYVRLVDLPPSSLQTSHIRLLTAPPPLPALFPQLFLPDTADPQCVPCAGLRPAVDPTGSIWDHSAAWNCHKEPPEEGVGDPLATRGRTSARCDKET